MCVHYLSVLVTWIFNILIFIHFW